MSRREKGFKWLSGRRNRAARHARSKHPDDNNVLNPSAVLDEESGETPMIESPDGPGTNSAETGDVTVGMTQAGWAVSQPALNLPTNMAIPALLPAEALANPELQGSIRVTHTPPADDVSTPVHDVRSAAALGDMSDAEAPVAAQTAVEPAGFTRATEPIAGMIETLTTAPTIGNVRGRPAPCLAAGVQYRAPMVVLDGLAVGPYHLAGASQSGTSHMINGSPRQDAYDFVLSATGRLIVAIADGLGSRPISQVGARLFCEHVTIAGTTNPDSSAQDYLITAAARAGAAAEAAYALTYDDVSFVAAVAVFSSERCELARIGDVSGFSLGADGVFEELFATNDGSVNVVTASLPSATASLPESKTTSCNVTVALVTDGLANDIRTSPSVRAWLGEQWRMPLGAYAMAESLRYRRQGSHDDRTGVVVWPQTSVLTADPNVRQPRLLGQES